MNGSIAIFAAFALTSQVVLLGNFVARRWWRSGADRYGWIAYAFGMLGLITGGWLVASGASWRLFSGPLLFAVWAAFGAWADLAARVEWRRPVRWPVLVPYVVLYLAAQMFLWWPMWDLWWIGWAVYLCLFVANTTLNIAGHFRGPEARMETAA